MWNCATRLNSYDNYFMQRRNQTLLYINQNQSRGGGLNVYRNTTSTEYQNYSNLCVNLLEKLDNNEHNNTNHRLVDPYQSRDVLLKPRTESMVSVGSLIQNFLKNNTQSVDYNPVTGENHTNMQKTNSDIPEARSPSRYPTEHKT